MARRETLDDLLRDAIEGRRFSAWCEEAGVYPWTVLRLRKGLGKRVHPGTVAVLAAKLRLPRERVLAAIVASRDARG